MWRLCGCVLRTEYMKHVVITLAVVSVFLVIPGCDSTKPAQQPQTGIESDVAPQPVEVKETAQTPGEEPLLLDDEPLLLDDEPLLLDDEPLHLEDEPLLLDDEPEEESADSGADNSRCHVCHINYAQEKIAVTHAKIGMGCATCHGESDEHIADESWASGGNGTAPDKMFPRDTINPSCMKCHTKEKIDEPQHAPVFAEGGDKKVCTDCHGEHRLPVRRCKWK